MKLRSPQLLVALWLVLIGCALWSHVVRTEQPPLHDALTYALKAKNFWANLHQARPANPLNLEPTIRPPGTVLMSYPLGFSEDVRGFYFRSVYFPILLFVAAVYVAGSAKETSRSEQWSLALLALYSSTLPMFYHLEEADGSPVYWGLVDNFLAGVAALSVAICIHSVRRQSLKWTLGAALLASLCLFIKPAGLLVMAVIGMSWLVTQLLTLKAVWLERRKRIHMLKLLAAGMLLFAAIFGVAVFLAFSSKYLSAENISYGAQAVRVLLLDRFITPYLVHHMIHLSFGYPLLAGILGLGLFLAGHSRTAGFPALWNKPLLLGQASAALLCFCVGLWFWLMKTGGAQVRYFFPFALMSLVCLTPFALWVFNKISRAARTCLWILLAILVINLALLLVLPEPPRPWQKLTGVSLVSGTLKQEVKLAQAMVSEARRQGKHLILYTISSGGSTPAGVLESTIGWESVLHPTDPVISVQRPFDWVRYKTFRLEELLHADYILFEPILVSATQSAVLAQRSIKTFEQEAGLMQAWFSRATQGDGVLAISTTSNLRLLKVVDSTKLDNALAVLEQQYTWRPEFREANPKRWWSEQELAELGKLQKLQAMGVRFGDDIKLNAVVLDWHEDELMVRLWWEPLKTVSGKQSFFSFIC